MNGSGEDGSIGLGAVKCPPGATMVVASQPGAVFAVPVGPDAESIERFYALVHALPPETLCATTWTAHPPDETETR